MRHRIVLMTTLLFVAVVARHTLAHQTSGPLSLKVFILAGQSNMEGQAVVDLAGKDYNDAKGTLVTLTKDPAKQDLFKHLKDSQGKWRVRDDVWIRYQREDRPLLAGPLTFGFTSYGDQHHFGPELQFGHIMGDALENEVLLIKTAWGGKSLYADFRPPSSGGTTGPHYTLMIQQVREALANIKKDFPKSKAEGYELAGFVWYHGWNDGCDPKHAVPEYETNLVNLIKDVRKDLAAPNLPVVIGEITGPWVQATGEWDLLRKAQAAAATHPEFAGNVVFVPTHDFVRKSEDSPNPGHAHHEFGNAETYFLVGDALGKAMARLLKPQPLPAAPVATSPPQTNFVKAAAKVTASIQKGFYNDKTGLYAQSLTNRDPEFMWGNGVMFSALVAAARHDPATYLPILDRFFTSMDRYWDTKSKVPGYEPAPTQGDGHDKYYDDNQWMVITFMEAYDLTQDVKYMNRAKEALTFSLSGWDDSLSGGIWWHEKHKDGSKNTCANAPAAVACLRVARYADAPANIDWARKLVKWTASHLQDKDARYFDNIRVKDSRVNKGKVTYNSGLMLRANLGLYYATKEEPFLTEARRIGAAAGAFIDKKTGAYGDPKRFSHLLVEADLALYRTTNDPALLARAKKNAQVAWSQWQSSPPKELIEQAAIARMLWLLVDQETEVGRAFWAKMDGSVSLK